MFLFKGLSDAEIAGFVNDDTCTVEKFAKGETIYSAEKYKRAMGYILSGTAEVNNCENNSVLIRCLKKGSCFGVAALFIDKDEDYVSQIVATTDCAVLFIPEETVVKAINDYPVVAMNYIRFLTDRIRYLNTLVDAYSSPNVETKLARFITAYVDGQDLPFNLNLTSLSRSLGTGRASLYRALDSLESGGMIRRKDKKITITDIEKLKSY